jgi:long-subunit acyl-CoA synthetase (AMP-forming)
VDDDGYVTIVDRKREIIISAAGKNMSPANIEQAIKGESSLIGQVVCIGDGRRYNTALITVDPEAAPRYGDGIAAEIERAVAAGNARLSTVEQIKKYTLLDSAWLPDSDELTPTMKLKRKPIAAKYAAEIEALYAE